MSAPSDDAPHAQPTIVLRPRRNLWDGALRELWQARELIAFFVWRDVKVRYKQTALGAAWALLQPLLLMLVFTLFLGRVSGVKPETMPYPLFAFAGVLPWTFFAAGLASAAQSVVAAERLVTKAYFPRLALPLSAVCAALVDLAVGCIGLALLLLWYGVAPGWGVLWLPLVVLLLALSAIGVGALFAALNVAYRDVRYVIPFLVQLWMFATPTVYLDPSAANDQPLVAWALACNPLSALVAAFRACVTGSQPDLEQLAVAGGLIFLFLAVGVAYFRRTEDAFADLI